MGSPSIHHDAAAPLEAVPLLDRKEEYSTTIAGSSPGALAAPPTDTGAKPRPFPQAIAHRGFKSAFPENTLAAFRAAVAAGAHALETDVHLSRDKVVVLSHDATLTRCFGVPDRISAVDWPYLSTVRTTRAPPLPMPRLVDLLAYLASDEPGARDVWVLLDIKKDDDPDELVKGIAAACAAVPAAPSAARAWRERVVLGCWDAAVIRRCQEHLPGFPIAYIGWSLPYARELLKIEGVHFNLLQQILVGPWGKRFLRQARERGRRVFVWTVNEEEWMDWSIGAGVDGVITDDPKLYLEVCRRWEDEERLMGRLAGRVKGQRSWWRNRANLTGQERGWRRWSKLYAKVMFWQVLAALVITLFRIPLGSERKRVSRALRR